MLLPILEKNQLIDAVVLHLYPQIRQWNLERNELAWDQGLETSMLSEEYKEFLDALTMVDRFDAICDFAFVLCGTYAKWMENPDDREKVTKFVEKYSAHFVDLYIIFTKYIMQEYHTTDLQEVAPLIIKGIEVVTKKNFEKGNERNAEGKVMKPKDFVGPEADLQEILNNFADSQA